MRCVIVLQCSNLAQTLHQITQNWMQLIHRKHIQLKGVHQSDKVLDSLSNSLGISCVCMILRGDMLGCSRNTDINQAMLCSRTFDLRITMKITSYLAIKPLISKDAPRPFRHVLYWAINLLHAEEYLQLIYDCTHRKE